MARISDFLIFGFWANFGRTYLEGFLSVSGFLADLGFSDQVVYESSVVSESEGVGVG